jgi:hypothetical protein
MARYFNYFPKTLYSADNRTSGLDTVTNLISRFTFEPSLKTNSAAFYKYDIQEGDTPEIIATKYYDNPERHWIVLAFNEIYDPQWDWPLQYKTFIDYVDKKYSAPEYADTANTAVTGLSWAMNVNNVEGYFKVVTRTNFDNISIIEKLQVDANTWATIGETTQSYTLQDGSSITEKVTKEKRTYYDFENEENEKKRNIKLLKPEFVETVEKEFKKVIKG